MDSLVAIIDQDFGDMIGYYRRFSCDDSFDGPFMVQPRDVIPLRLTSIESLFDAMWREIQRGRTKILIGMHGAPEQLPYDITNGSHAAADVEFFQLLKRAVDNDSSSRDTLKGWQNMRNQSVFRNEAHLDRVINLARNIRNARIDRIEFRGCNIGAGGCLTAIHECLNAKTTAAPRVDIVSGRIRPIVRRRTSQEIQDYFPTLGSTSRIFSRADCFMAFSNRFAGTDAALTMAWYETDPVRHRFDFRFMALGDDAFLGWTRAFLDPALNAITGHLPPGGGYRAGAPTPLIGFWTPDKRVPFVFPGEGLAYTQFIVAK